MFKLLCLLFVFSTFLRADIYDYDIKPSSFETSKFMSLKILDSKELKFNSSNINELSALAYKNNLLYALNDKSVLSIFEFKIKNNKIKKLILKKTIKLKTKKLNELKKNKSDSEGLTFLGDDLLISFERKPRVELFSINGKKIKSKKIHKDLQDLKNYKSKNKGLESVAYNKKYGILTAPEVPLKKKKKYHTIYSKKRTWRFLACGSITALEFMNKDEIMILQRDFNDFTRQRVITISRLNLETLKYDVLATLDTKKGWNIDNFEGLTKFKDKKYLMVSDDNDSFLQKTLLVLFEVD